MEIISLNFLIFCWSAVVYLISVGTVMGSFGLSIQCISATPRTTHTNLKNKKKESPKKMNEMDFYSSGANFLLYCVVCVSKKKLLLMCCSQCVDFNGKQEEIKKLQKIMFT